MRKSISIIISSLFVGYFAFGFSNVVHAACSYSLTFDANPKTVAGDGKVRFNTSISVSGNEAGADCRDSVTKLSIRYFVTSAGQPSTQPYYGKNDISGSIILNLVNGSTNDSRDFYLNNFFTADGKDKSGRPVVFPVTTGSFFVRIYEYISVTGRNLTTSAVVPFTVTTPSQAPPEVSLNVPQAKLGDEVTLTVARPPVGWKKGTIYINGFSGSNYYEFTSSPFKFKVDSSKGFVSGANNLVVQIENSSGNSVALPNAGKIVLNVMAVNPPNPAGRNSTSTPAGRNSTSTPAGHNPIDTSLKETLFNPLPTDSLTGAFLTVAKGFLAIIALWAITFIIIGAFKLIMAQGHEEDYVTAKKTITWAVLGLIVAMLSFSIIAIVQNILQIKVPPLPTGNSSKGDNPVENKTK